jgi:hypothetical protein
MARTTRGYSLGSPLENIFPQPIVSTRNPTAADTNYELGQVWVNTGAATSFMLNQISGGTASWTQLTAGTSDVDTINSLPPVAGDIVIAGGTNVTDVNAGNTVTLNLDAAITLATSVTSPLYTAAAGTDVQITAPANQDLNLRMGDAAGAQAVVFEDSTGATVFSVDSSGGIPALGAVTINGLLTANASAIINTAGTALNLGTDNSGDALNIGTGNVIRAITVGGGAAAHTVTVGSGAAGNIAINAGAGTLLIDSNGVLELNSAAGVIGIGNDAVAQNINVGTGAAARTITVGNVTGATAVNLNAGTGGIALASTGAGDITINSDDTLLLDADGVLELNSSAGVISIGNDADAQNINLGTAGARTLAIGNTTAATAVNMSVGTGNFTLEGDVASTYDISATGANTGTCTFGAGTGARIVNLGTGAGGAKTINIGTAAIGNIITIGTVTAAASLDLLCGTGNFTLEGNVASTYDISATGANTGTCTFGAGTGARIINLGTGAGGVKTINIGTAAIGNIITIGTVTAAASLDLLCGTGNFTLEGNVASTYDISATGANTGTVTIGAGTGARIVNLGTGAGGAKTINIGTAAIGNIITIGTVTAAASLDLLCGTGNFTLEGDVASTYDISATGVNTGTVRVASGTGARIVEIGGGGTGAKTINIGAAASADVITIGDATGAGSLDLVCGTGNFSLEGNVATTYSISGAGVNTGLITIGGGTGAQTLNMMNATGVKTVNIASGAAANVVTVGSTNGAASLTLQSGTGDITMTGTIKEATTEFVTRSGDFVTFTMSPLGQSNANTGVAPTGVNGDVNLLTFQEGMIMEQFIIGTQTILVPRMDATGLLASLDLTNTDGWELNYGAARANSRLAMTIGTSAAFFMELRYTLADVSGCEPFMFGFRRTQANQAAFANYTDFAAIGVDDGVAGGDAIIQTQLNTGGVNSTDTNDAFGDGTTHTMQVLVSAAGVTTFTIDGAPPTATQAYTFDNGDVVHPFIHNLFGAAAPGNIHLQWLKVGFQA